MQNYRFVCAGFLACLVLPIASAGPIELKPGLWQIDSEETQDVAKEGRIGTRAPITTSDMRCLDTSSAWLIPADYAHSFNSRGCVQQSLVSNFLDFKGTWTCRVDGLDLTIDMQGEASLTGDKYSTVMKVVGRNNTSSVNVRNSVSAVRTGECPVEGLSLIHI